MKSDRLILLVCLLTSTGLFVTPQAFSQEVNAQAWGLARQAEDRSISVDERLALLSAGFELCQQGDCADTTLAYLYQRKSVLTFQELREYEAGINLNEAAINLYRRQLGATHPKTINTLFNSGYYAYALRDHEEALARIDSAIALVQNATPVLGFQADSALVNYNYYRMRLYERMGNPAQAVFYGKWGLAKIQAYPARKAVYLNAMGLIYLHTDRPDQALTYFNAVDKLRPNNPIIMENIGLCYFLKNDEANANTYLQRSLELMLSQQRSSRREARLAKLWYNLGLIHIRQREFAQATQALEEIATHLARLPNEDQQALLPDLYYLRSRIHLGQQDYPEAIKTTDSLLSLTAPDIDLTEYTFTTIRAARKTIVALDIQAKARAALGEVETVLATVDLINRIAADNRRRSSSNISKLFINQKLTSSNELALKICHQRWQLTQDAKWLAQAYAFAGANKAILLLESLQASQAIEYAGLPFRVQEQEQLLADSVMTLQTARYQALATNAPSDSLELVLLATQQRYSQLQKTLEQDYPRYYKLKYAYQSPPTPDQVGAKLPPDQATLDFFMGADTLFTFVLTSAGQQFYAQPIPAGFNDSLALYRELLNNGVDQDCEPLLIRLSRYLYEVLLSTPLRALDSRCERLILIPDGILNFLAFETLLDRDLLSLKGSEGFLLERFACSYAYTSRLLVDNPAAAKRASEGFLGLGLEYNKQTLDYLQTLSFGKEKRDTSLHLPCKLDVDTSRQFGKLAYSDDEIRAIGDLTKGKAILNEAARKDAFLALAPKHNILHLAMHGSYDIDFPLNSALIFSRAESDDIFLRAAEIYGLELSGELAVLSACNTANGKLEPGEGVMSLARAFHYAGIPSVVASMWSIPDKSSSSIMQLFYQQLDQGLPKDIALQRAKLTYLASDDWSSPSSRMPVHWGAAVLIGNVEAIRIRSSSKTWWWLALLLLAGGWWLLRKRRASVLEN